MSVPLQVRLLAEDRESVITADLLDDITFRSTIPGGYASCSASVARSLSTLPGELDAFTGVEVVDTRHGGIVWAGRLDVPGRQAGNDGEVFSLVAVGGQSHATDNTLPVIYNDARLPPWEDISKEAYPGSRVSTAQIGGLEGEANTRLMLEFPRGMNLASQARAAVRYPHLLSTGQRVGRIDVGMQGRRTEPDLRGQIVGRASTGSAATAILDDAGMTTAEQILVATPAAVYFLPELRLFWDGAAGTLIGDDTSYFLARGLRVQGARLNADGTPVTSYPGPTIPTWQIVADVLGRFLPECDGVHAALAASPFEVDQLAYEDGVTAQQILEDLMSLDPGFSWAIWERGPDGFRFEWTAYPTEVALDVDTTDGFSSPGSVVDLFNEVAVRWLDVRGQTRTLVRTADSPPLTAAGLTRRARIDLGSQAGSQAQAERAGGVFLEQHRLPSNNGQLRISRPVVDHLSGRVLQPWEILPGVLVRVRDVAPRQDALNPTTGDAVTIFRVAETAYSSQDNTCTLTLDAFTWAVERQIAGLAKRAARQLRP